MKHGGRAQDGLWGRTNAMLMWIQEHMLKDCPKQSDKIAYIYAIIDYQGIK